MARGWESKSVESQMESASNDKGGSAPQLSPDEKNRKREQQSLLLSRAYLMQKINSSTSSRYTESLQEALKEIDARLAAINSRSDAV